MSTGALAAIVALASFALLHLGASLVARRGRASAPSAGRLFARAVWPTLVPAFAAMLIVLPSFFWHEAPQEEEWPGVILVLLALAGGARLGVILARAARMLLASRAVTKAWRRAATPLPLEPWGLRASKIDTGCPMVAVAGLITPHVFVDRRVLDACSPAELAAVAAHERAHVASRDNLRRLMIAACEGLASDTARAWRAAAELAADERAARTPRAAAELASALLRVARAAPPSMVPIAVSTIHDGGSLEARVRRLLAFAPAERSTLDRRTWPLALSACAALAGLMLGTPLPKALHGGLELLVQHLF